MTQSEHVIDPLDLQQQATDQKWMTLAMQLAQQAELKGEVPVGAVLVKDDVMIASGFNLSILNHDPTAHAEIVAIRGAAKKIGNYRLDELTMVVTLEPCGMCAGAIAQSRIKRLVFGAFDKQAGAVGSIWDLLRDARTISKIEVISGVLDAESSSILRDFFKNF